MESTKMCARTSPLETAIPTTGYAGGLHRASTPRPTRLHVVEPNGSGMTAVATAWRPSMSGALGVCGGEVRGTAVSTAGSRPGVAPLNRSLAARPATVGSAVRVRADLRTDLVRIPFPTDGVISVSALGPPV